MVSDKPAGMVLAWRHFGWSSHKDPILMAGQFSQGMVYQFATEKNGGA